MHSFKLFIPYLCISLLSFWGGLEYQKLKVPLLTKSPPINHQNTLVKNSIRNSSIIKNKLLASSVTTSLEKIKLGTMLMSSTALEEESVIALESIIERSSEADIEEVLTLFFGQNDLLQEVDDVRSFSLRLLEELGDTDTPSDEFSNAQIYFSLSSDYPEAPQQHFDISKRQKIYAHINTHNGLGIGDGKFFTRWKNKTTGEVLLFKQKPIVRDSNKNWVSFAPDSSWEDGPYEVNFYQFNSTLNKLSSNNFYITVK